MSFGHAKITCIQIYQKTAALAKSLHCTDSNTNIANQQNILSFFIYLGTQYHLVSYLSLKVILNRISLQGVTDQYTHIPGLHDDSMQLQNKGHLISYRLFGHPYDRQFIRFKTTMGYILSKKADLDQNPKCSDHKLRS